MLPIHAATTGIENAAYDARRGRVAAHLRAHAGDIRRGDARAFAQLWDIARTPAARRAKAQREIVALPVGPDWVEHATIIVMVHS